METLAWISHPAKARKKASIITVILIIAVLVIVYYMTYSVLMVMLGVVLFTAALSTFFFPTRFEISKDKVKVKYLFTSVQREMRAFRTYYPDKNGVLLSPFIRPSRLENFRGLYIRYHQNKAEVDAFVKKIFEERESDV